MIPTLHTRHATLLIAAALVLAGCGGGGGSATAPRAAIIPAAVALPTPTVAPVPSAPATSVPTTPTSTKVVLVITSGTDQAAQAVARKAASGASRSALYVSPGTLGVSVTTTPSNLVTVSDVSSGSPNCTTTGSGRTCTVAVQASPGNDTFALTTYNAAPVSGAIPTGASALGLSTVTQTIVANTANTVDFYIGAIIASLATGASYASLPADGNTHAYGLSLIAEDASGNVVTGGTNDPFATPITVTLQEAGGSGHAHLVLNGTNAGTSASVAHSSDTLSLSYDGAGSPGYTTSLAISANSASASLRVSPMYVTGSLAATDAGQTNTASISEASAPGSIAYGTSWTCSGFALASSNLGSGASGALQVTSPAATAGSPLLGSYACANATVSDSLGTSVAVPVSASIPTAPTCASAASTTYIGVKSGSSYEVANGSPCTLTVAPTANCVAGSPISCTLYLPPSGALPTSGAVSVSEANDTTAPSVDASNCATVATVAPSLAPGASLSAAMGGTVPIATANSTSSTGATCSILVHDNNGQTQTVNLNADPSVSSPTGGGTLTFSESVDPYGTGVTAGSGVEYVGYHSASTTGTPLTFTTNAISFSGTMGVPGGGDWADGDPGYPDYSEEEMVLYSVSANKLYCLESNVPDNGLSIPTETFTLPNGPGQYYVGVSANLSNQDYSQQADNVSIPFTFTAVQAPNGSGTFTPSGLSFGLTNYPHDC